ncbi:hypothetical protein Tco_0506590 [Tanacetum coccineum]
MPLLDAMLPPAQAAIADEGLGEAAPDVPQTILETIHETRPEPDQSHAHLPTPPRPTTSAQIPPVFDQGHTSDPNIDSFSGAHASDPDLFTSTTVEDEPLGGSFQTTPPRSTPVPPVGPTSGGAEDLATLTALSSLVSELVQKVSILETDLKAHKLLFKDVVPKLVKRVKALEVKLNTKKRKVVLSDSNQEDSGDPNVDLDALNALASAAVTVDSTKSPGGPSKNPVACSYDPTSDVPTTEVPSTEFPTDVPSDGAPIGPSTISPGSTTVPTSSSVPAGSIIPDGTTPATPSSPIRDAIKGKGVAVEELTPPHDKTFTQLEEERLGWEAAQRLQAQELADFEKQSAAIRVVALIAERRRAFVAQRFQEKRNKPMTYALQKAYMRTFVKNQSTTIYTTGWTMKYVKSLSDEQLKSEFEKIRTAIADLQSLNIRRTLKRAGEDLEHDVSKKPKPTEVPKSSPPDVPHQQATNVPPVDPP